jgi:conjugative transfer region lipoprotein (TIGR03751 family)
VAAWIRAAARSALLALPILASCASGSKEDLLPQTGPTMREVYDRHFQGGGGTAEPADGTQAPLMPGVRAVPVPRDLDGYSRSPANEINSQFPRLPNPDLVLYVFPHMSESGYPVPGYSTVIPLWETVEYALPGEKEGW